MSPSLLVTVDVEALPGRAEWDHVSRLIWGEHPGGRAGIAEICDVVEEFGGVALFFLEVAGSLHELAAYREVNSYLERRGHLVEWHFHPEILGRNFWRARGATGSTMRQDLFNEQDAGIILEFGLDLFRRIAGRSPRAYRAGSFRWNQHVIDFLGRNGVPYSFNACAETAVRDNFETYQPKSSKPFLWSNGVIEVPCGEVSERNEIVHFRFPRRFPDELPPKALARRIAEESGGPVQLLLHSWSLLHRNEQDHFVYAGEARKEALRGLIGQLSSQCPVPATVDEYCEAINNVVAYASGRVPLSSVRCNDAG